MRYNSDTETGALRYGVIMARVSSREKDYTSYPFTPEKQMEQPSGWCMTQDHEGCKYQFNHGKCGCTCHTLSKIQKTQITEEVAFIADSNDPRPWRKT
jgi:hypothetical protein